MQIICRLKGVTLSAMVFFGGGTFVSRFSNSVIRIGSRCRFMSLTTGNLIGLHHRCILATENSGAELTIGNHCSFSGVSIWCFKKITLGNHVRVGANVNIMDGDAHPDDPRAGENNDVIIEDNVWIGADVMVLKGVTIGRNSLIGARSVVVKSIPPNVIAAGNPCRVLRKLDEKTINEVEKQ